jgi:hypothetical protein
MIELVIGIVGAFFLFLIGRYLVPENESLNPVINEPWERDYKKYSIQEQKTGDENE